MGFFFLVIVSLTLVTFVTTKKGVRENFVVKKGVRLLMRIPPISFIVLIKKPP